MLEIRVAERHHGPVFDGRAQHALDQAVHDIAQEVADVGKNDVINRLHSVLRHETPYYSTRIRTERVTADRYLINDGPSTFKYGPWLEGTGSRNPVTSFKGYHTFAVVTRQLDAKAGYIADRVLARHLPEMR